MRSFTYEFTLLSNFQPRSWNVGLFVSPTNLHCSQTFMTLMLLQHTFVSPTNLHCSQTVKQLTYSLLNVCFPYEFTLLSNVRSPFPERTTVCFPYEFTLLSNQMTNDASNRNVCFPYEFTLLSNFIGVACGCFRFVSPTNLHCSQTSNCLRIIFCKISASIHRSHPSSLY